MKTFTNFDGRTASFGNYGGQRVSNRATGYSKGYWTLWCCLCPDGDVRKALYHCGGHGYCKLHKQAAIDRRLKYRDTQEGIAARFEAERQAKDNWDKNNPTKPKMRGL